MEKITFFVLLFELQIVVFVQQNSYPSSGSVTIYDYSHSVILQRNTSAGGFVEGIQTRLQDGTNNWYFVNLHSGSWIVSKSDIIGYFNRTSGSTGGSSILRLNSGTSIGEFEMNSRYSSTGLRFGSYFDINIGNNTPGGSYGAIMRLSLKMLSYNSQNQFQSINPQ
jgi:hypothetical protein